MEMAELQSEIAYWVSVAIRASLTFPAFIGHNWPGILLSFALLLPSARERIKNHLTSIRTLAWSGKFLYTGRALMSTNWKTVASIVGIFLFANFLTVGFHDYSNAVNQKQDVVEQLNTARSELGAGNLSCQLQTADIRSDRDSEKAKNQVLENQNLSQQSTINGCLSQAIKLISPVTPQIRSFPTPNIKREGVVQMDYILTTNTQRTPVDLIAACDFSVVDASFHILTESGGAIGNDLGRSLSPMRYEMIISSPAWVPSDPLKVTLFLGNPVTRMPSCSFSPR